MYQLVEQSVSEARASLTQTLKRMASGEDIVVVVRKRGDEPQGVIIPPAEWWKYRRWRSEQDRTNGDGDSAGRVREAAESSPEGVLPAQQIPRRTYPDGLPTPKEFVEHHVACGLSPEKIFRGLMHHYSLSGVPEEEAEDIVMGIIEKQAAKVRSLAQDSQRVPGAEDHSSAPRITGPPRSAGG